MEGVFVTLKKHGEYEMLTVPPHTIRRKINHYEVSECDDGNGYVLVNLNGKSYRKHRLVAEQFIPNPNNYKEVDHRNHIRHDNRIENLQWTNRTGNLRNKLSSKHIKYEYVDSINENAIVVTKYKEYDLMNYYFHEDNFYYFNGQQYRKLHVCVNGQSKYVHVITEQGKDIKISYKTFKHEYHII